MIRPGVVPYATVDSLVRVSCPFGAELPYRPVIRVFGVEEGDEAVERVAVGSLGVCLARSRAGRKRCTVSLRASCMAARAGCQRIGRIDAGTHVTMMSSVT